ncbi:MAG TPA: glycosyl hydrolase family 28-related protein [Methyloceanibacter sp.]|nr:glycosyl hydrolase family 28-related protein [Methyloceanibacter sp.]
MRAGIQVNAWILWAAALTLSATAYSTRAQAEAPKICAPPPATPLVVDVKDKGAKGDGKADDTAAIQAAIDHVAGSKGTVLVPNGVYMVDAVRGKSLRLRSDMTFKLAGDAVLKAFPNASKNYAVLTIADASNVWVTGGTLEGERDKHKGKSGEWGMGIHIGKQAKHITITNVTSKKMWGDGFFGQSAEDVRFCSVVADGNRCQGLSIIDADGLLVSHSVFKNTSGTRPSAGIDLEPDKDSQRIVNVRIANSKFLDDAGAGTLVAGKKARISKVEMTGNT